MSRLLGQVQSLLVSSCVIACAAAPSVAQPGSPAGSPDDGGLFQWSTVNLSGNALYIGNPGDLESFGTPRAILFGRGSVAAPFRISRTEMTHAQWLPFLNALNGNPAVYPQLDNYFSTHPVALDISGQIAPGFNFANGPSGTQTYALRNQGWANVPVQMTWRLAAMYCNWMHNDRSGTFDSFMTGAYNVYSWGDNFNGTFTDDAARMPGARFFIPNLDESIAAAHWDPNRNGPNQGGYWLYGNSSDTAPVYGTPGTLDPFGRPVTATGVIAPVASIPGQQSPWGLWDSVGGMGEWVENPIGPTGTTGSRFRRTDRVDQIAWSNVYNLHNATIRIASIVPSPSATGVLCLFGVLGVSRRRR